MNNKKTMTIVLGIVVAVLLIIVMFIIIKYVDFGGDEPNPGQDPGIIDNNPPTVDTTPVDSAYLKIDCDGTDISNTYKMGDSFSCSLLNKEFKITIKSMTKGKIELEADQYGLFPQRDDGTYSLIDNVKDFDLYKDKELTLSFQATDVSSNIKINY